MTETALRKTERREEKKVAHDSAIAYAERWWIANMYSK